MKWLQCVKSRDVDGICIYFFFLHFLSTGCLVLAIIQWESSHLAPRCRVNMVSGGVAGRGGTGCRIKQTSECVLLFRSSSGRPVYFIFSFFFFSISISSSPGGLSSHVRRPYAANAYLSYAVESWRSGLSSGPQRSTGKDF